VARYRSFSPTKNPDTSMSPAKIYGLNFPYFYNANSPIVPVNGAGGLRRPKATAGVHSSALVSALGMQGPSGYYDDSVSVTYPGGVEQGREVAFAKDARTSKKRSVGCQGGRCAHPSCSRNCAIAVLISVAVAAIVLVALIATSVWLKGLVNFFWFFLPILCFSVLFFFCFSIS